MVFPWSEATVLKGLGDAVTHLGLEMGHFACVSRSFWDNKGRFGWGLAGHCEVCYVGALSLDKGVMVAYWLTGELVRC